MDNVTVMLNFLADLFQVWAPLIGAVGITWAVVYFVVFILCK